MFQTTQVKLDGGESGFNQRQKAWQVWSMNSLTSEIVAEKVKETNIIWAYSIYIHNHIFNHIYIIIYV